NKKTNRNSGHTHARLYWFGYFARSSNDSKLSNPICQLAILAASIAAQNTSNMTKGKDENLKSIMSVKPITRCEKWNASLVNATDALKKLGYDPRIANLFLEGKTENYIASSQNISWNKIQELRVHLENMNLINYSQQDYEFHLVTNSIDHGNIFRPRRPEKISNPLKTYRERILHILKSGETSRQHVRLTENRALIWLRKHDAEWLNQFLPTQRISIPDTIQKRTAYRNQVLVFMTAYPNTTRTNIDKNLRTQFRWCFLNDTEWLNKVVPGAGKAGRRANSKVPNQVTTIGVGLDGQNS
ncbi:hypothetical protein QN372_20685, partial [Undibacterium sp. RTI2.1]|uniref:hypothetical protein n=1 Tax=unclassified Undibacterium TaxID=2630295 RepID=UPI002B23046D